MKPLIHASIYNEYENKNFGIIFKYQKEQKKKGSSCITTRLKHQLQEACKGLFANRIKITFWEMSSFERQEQPNMFHFASYSIMKQYYNIFQKMPFSKNTFKSSFKNLTATQVFFFCIILNFFLFSRTTNISRFHNKSNPK